MIVAVVASMYVSLGMRAYARIQKFCFYGGLVGLAVMIVILLFSSRSDFVSAYNSGAQELFGAGGNAYQATIAAGEKAGGLPVGNAVYPTLLLIPFLAFFNLYSNWGATLYGEVRGASDFRKNIYAMAGALIFTSIFAVILLLLFAKTFGWDFYYAANSAFWAGTGPVSAWPYPGLLVAMLLGNPILQIHPDGRAVPLVLRVDRVCVPVIDPRRFRHRLRPGAPRVGLPDNQQRRPLRGAAAHAHTVYPGELRVCFRG